MKNITDFGLKYYAFDWDDNILKMPTVNQSLDQRLAHDFPIFESSFPKQNILNKSSSSRATIT